jgi:hypothetical protein
VLVKNHVRARPSPWGAEPAPNQNKSLYLQEANSGAAQKSKQALWLLLLPGGGVKRRADHEEEEEGAQGGLEEENQRQLGPVVLRARPGGQQDRFNHLQERSRV